MGDSYLVCAQFKCEKKEKTKVTMCSKMLSVISKMSTNLTVGDINIGFSQDISIIFELLILGVLLSFFGIMGLVGNFLSILVLTRRQMKGSTNFILMGLAYSDLILIISR